MKKSVINQSNILFVFLQAFFTLLSLIAVIMYFFDSRMKIFIPFCFGFTLCVLSFNNYKIYHKRFFTIIYVIFGIISIFYGTVLLGG